ncbi:hypothetical protein M2454_001741 [Aequitasia blattaphilus]|uniref:RloB family protein n=1 Tax=Aequitasia blattaphilus TaxID=2949332 RepID=A0ABT1E891_9FIRM|nr:RloB family protein [Aequitasia blattaphilus]MCP1102038.1 RloB family protein [Aequitasia blattaphilus]MCR8614678.1 RloB family protein [Aequitasia blattaphilus]
MRKDRVGNREPRSKRKNKRCPNLGYYLIVTDTEGTERCYFEGIRDSIKPELRDRLVIRVIETDTDKMISKCLELMEYDSQYRIPWIVFDRDRVPTFDGIIDKASRNDIQVGWSNPCFEIWLYAYLGKMPAIHESWTCGEKFGVAYKHATGQAYSKTSSDIYSRLCKYGDEPAAIRLAELKLQQCIREGKTLPSEMYPATTVHDLIREIKVAIECGAN